MPEKINAVIIIEVMGKPPAYIKESLEKLIEKMSGENGVKIINKKINSPKKLEKTELFTTFAEIELELDSVIDLVKIIFAYLPSHIEVIKPENVQISNYELNFLFNQISMRLHEYDSVAKSMLFEKSILENKLKQLSQPAQYKFVQKEEKKPEKAQEKVKKTKKKKR